MYDIVMNVVTPARISVRTVVLFSDRRKSFSSIERGSPPGTGGVARSAGVVAHRQSSSTEHPSCAVGAASPPVSGGEPRNCREGSTTPAPVPDSQFLVFNPANESLHQRPHGFPVCRRY